MPVITIEVPKVTNEQKSKIVKEIVAKVSEIINVSEENITTIIKENELIADNQAKI